MVMTEAADAVVLAEAAEVVAEAGILAEMSAEAAVGMVMAEVAGTVLARVDRMAMWTVRPVRADIVTSSLHVRSPVLATDPCLLMELVFSTLSRVHWTTML